MKKLQPSAARVLIAGIFAAGLSVISGSVLAGSAGLAFGYTGSSDAMLLASTSYKGAHPYKDHATYEREAKKDKAARFEETPTVKVAIIKGKPPYHRHVTKQQLEKVQFARLEEKSWASKGKHESIYHGAQGKHPPFSRN